MQSSAQMVFKQVKQKKKRQKKCATPKDTTSKIIPATNAHMLRLSSKEEYEKRLRELRNGFKSLEAKKREIDDNADLQWHLFNQWMRKRLLKARKCSMETAQATNTSKLLAGQLSTLLAKMDQIHCLETTKA